MVEPAVIPHALGQHFFAGMSKRRMTKIVRQSDRFRQVFIQSQGPRDGAADRGDLDGMGQAGSQMIARSIEENLRLVFQAAKGA